MPTIKGVRVPDKELQYEAAVNNVSADTIHTASVWVDLIRIVNTNAAARTITILDGQGSPVSKYNEVSIAGDSVSHENFETPFECVSGLTAQASDTGLIIKVHGWHKPTS